MNWRENSIEGLLAGSSQPQCSRYRQSSVMPYIPLVNVQTQLRWIWFSSGLEHWKSPVMSIEVYTTQPSRSARSGLPGKPSIWTYRTGWKVNRGS